MRFNQSIRYDVAQLGKLVESTQPSDLAQSKWFTTANPRNWPIPNATPRLKKLAHRRGRK
jgi:hypothetical protein